MHKRVLKLYTRNWSLRQPLGGDGAEGWGDRDGKDFSFAFSTWWMYNPPPSTTLNEAKKKKKKIPGGREYTSSFFCMPSCFSCVQLLATPWTVAARLLCPWDSPGKNTGVGCHALLQGVFPTQELNLGLPHCRQILYHLSHLGNMR